MGLLGLIVYLVVVGLVFYVLWWGIGQMGLPEPINKILTVVVVLVLMLVLLNVLFGFMPGPVFHWRE